jgi:hypothetical protein
MLQGCGWKAVRKKKDMIAQAILLLVLKGFGTGCVSIRVRV